MLFRFYSETQTLWLSYRAILVDNESNPDIGADFIAEVVSDFHSVMSGLPAPLATLNTVGKLFTADAAEKAAARGTIATMNAGKESLELRYK